MAVVGLVDFQLPFALVLLTARVFVYCEDFLLATKAQKGEERRARMSGFTFLLAFRALLWLFLFIGCGDVGLGSPRDTQHLAEFSVN